MASATKLINAISSKNIEVLTRILAKDKSLLTLDLGLEICALGWAAYASAPVVECVLAAGADPNGIQGCQGRTALYFAIQYDKPTCAEALIRGGANVNHVDSGGRTPLLFAASSDGGKSLEIVQQLLHAGAKVDPGTAKSPLMGAAANGPPAVVQALLDAGAQVNFQSPEYGTALIAATVANRPENVAILLKAGADQSIRLSPGQLYEYGVDDGELTQKCAIEIARLRKLKKVVLLLEAATKGGATKGGAKVKQRQPIDVTATWKTLDAWFRRERPSLKKTLRAGAAASDIKRVERRLGRDLPGEFKQSCQVHDGQKAGAECLVPALRAGEPGFVLLTLDQVAAAWIMHKRLLDSGEFSGSKSQASAEVSRDWWSPGWIPFASDGGGDFLCLDMAPAAKGTVGQVISFRHDSGERRRLAVSFGDWLNALCSELQDD